MEQELRIARGLGESLAGGAFYRCDASGRALLSGSAALEECLGVSLGELYRDLGGRLAKNAPQSFDELFAPEGEEPRAAVIPYAHPAAGKRWLALSRAPAPGGEEGCLVFLRDETPQRENERKVAEAQSKDIENSARLQAAVLSEGRKLEAEGIDYQTAAVPSKLVDGDFIEVLGLEAGSTDFILGDVMGKGMDAAILGAMIKYGFLRSLAGSLFEAERLPGPDLICARAEEAVAERLRSRHSFATLTYARFDSEASVLYFVDCGHTSIAQYSRRSGECWRVKGANMPLGFIDRQSYRTFAIPVDRGDVILLFTDGLSECVNRWGEALGEERIMYLTRTYADLSVSSLASAVMKIGFDYSAAGFNDDVSIICIKERGDWSGESLERELELRLRPSDDEAFREAEGLLEADLAAWAGAVAAEGRAELVLALHEAMMNVMKHSLTPDGGSCSLRWRLRAGMLTIEIAYLGIDYDWSTSPSLPRGRYAESGYGRFIMGEAMDSVLLARGHHGMKRLVMCRRLFGKEEEP
jgi:sigma-B regulation protein RsbU (phosphoserine phosphatase)